MKPSNELFKFIHSLTKSEKRFFKLSSSFQSGEKNYVKLFDFIEQQERYDEDVLKNHFKDETFIKHLPSEKNFLYSQILRSLRVYYSEHDTNSKLVSELQNIEILFEKHQYKVCRKRIVKGKRLARKFEKFYYLIAFINWEKKLLDEAIGEGRGKLSPQEIRKEELEVLEVLENFASLKLLYSKAEAEFNAKGYFYDCKEDISFVKIIEDEVFSEANTKSVKADIYAKYIVGIYNAMSNNHDEALMIFKKIDKIFDEHADIKSDFVNFYLQTLNASINSYALCRDLENAESILNKIKFLEQTRLFSSKRSKNKAKSIVLIQSLYLNNMNGNFKESIAIYNDWGGEFIDEMSKSNQLIAHYCIAYSFYLGENPKQALKHINEVLNDSNLQIRLDIIVYAKILELAIHTELGNYDLLNYLVNSTNRYLNKMCSEKSALLVVLKHFKKIINKKDPHDIELLSAYEKELQDTLKSKEYKVDLYYLHFFAWIRAKRNHTSVATEINSVNN